MVEFILKFVKEHPETLNKVLVFLLEHPKTLEKVIDVILKKVEQS